MTKDSQDYKDFIAKYEAEQEERRNNPEKYPYFLCSGYGFQSLAYLTEKEVKEEVKFYNLKSDGKGGYFRYGRQAITIVPRKA